MEITYKGKTRLWKCENGHVYKMPNIHCVFCKHCPSIFYDSTGPYMFICKLEKELEITETECNCNPFEDNGYMYKIKKKENIDNKFEEMWDKFKERIIGWIEYYELMQNKTKHTAYKEVLQMMVDAEQEFHIKEE